VFQLSKNNGEEEYLIKLFSKERLEGKMKYFRQLCFPSITNQTNTNWKWFIFISHFLPEEYILELEKMIEPFQGKIILHFVANITDFKNLSKTLLKDERQPFITSRIDDDDGISDIFVEEILKYSFLSNHVINFVKGQETFLKNDKIEFGKKIQYYNNSVGLSVVNENIFSLGSHVKIHEKNHVIYNTSPSMFFLTHDEIFCDTHRKKVKN